MCPVFLLDVAWVDTQYAVSIGCEKCSFWVSSSEQYLFVNKLPAVPFFTAFLVYYISHIPAVQLRDPFTGGNLILIKWLVTKFSPVCTKCINGCQLIIILVFNIFVLISLTRLVSMWKIQTNFLTKVRLVSLIQHIYILKYW